MTMVSIQNSKCTLVIGATSGIGRALALSIAELPSHPQVVAVGRRQERLDELAAAKLETLRFDVDTDGQSLKRFVDDTIKKYRELDTVIYCAGIEREFDLTKEVDIEKLTHEININYTSVVSMISFFMPHFLSLAAQGRPCIIVPVTSGLAIVPGAWIPNYSACKAALHSFSTSLRVQLEGTNVHVMEIIPPLVESELHNFYESTERLAKFWIPLDEYTKTTMEGLKAGEGHISTGLSRTAFQNFEEGKLEVVRQTMEQRKAW